MGYQSGLPVDNPSYPDQLHNEDNERVYHLLGVDEDGQGHYWLGSEMLHSVVVAVNEDYNVEQRMDWLTRTSVAEYVEERDLDGLSDLAEMHLEKRNG